MTTSDFWRSHNIPDQGAVVMLKGGAEGVALWEIRRVVGKITGKDGVRQGIKLEQLEQGMVIN